ncbi:hypothetical protein QQ054_33490 [Oscillatoria amoena NRMC-F 0135]|nr:hypothetical protein [Oscillatoria amoena NRMC-F 0135]
MKNIIIGLITGALVVFLILYLPQCLSTEDKAAKRNPVLSLADLALEKMSNDSAPDAAELAKLQKFDRQVYQALHKDGPLSKKYFYARNGSCCPCTSGGLRCCDCSRGTGFAAPSSQTELAMNHGNSVYRFTDAQLKSTLKMDMTTDDGVDVFVVPPGTPEGTHTLYFDGNIRISLKIEIDGKGNIKVLEVN